jgi:xylan 1,4-beta-xylosidase
MAELRALSLPRSKWRGWDRMAAEAGVIVLREARLRTITIKRSRLVELQTERGDKVRAKMFIDATYEPGSRYNVQVCSPPKHVTPANLPAQLMVNLMPRRSLPPLRAGLSWMAIVLGLAICTTGARADLTIDATARAQPPDGVKVGRDVELVTIGDTAALSFGDEAIVAPLASCLSAESGTIRARFQVPRDWPSDSRETLFHVGEEAHIHVTMFAKGGRLMAVYKSGPEHYAAISSDDSVQWEPGRWHEAVFSWQADGTSVDFNLEVDGKLVGRNSGRLIEVWPEYGYIGARRRGQSWRGVLNWIRLSPTSSLPLELRPGSRTIVVDGDSNQGVCYNFWSISNYTSQHMFADPNYGKQAKIQKPFMKYVNCVRLLGGRHDGRNAWFKGVDGQGNVQCDFTQLIRYLRGIQEAGYTPRIVLDNIPTAMSEPGELATYGNTRPAKDLKVWHQYVQSAVQAMADAFGLETVSGWRFRVGTEPDLNPGHWQGTKEQYLRHYDCTVDAVCSVIPEAEIGPGNILNPAHAFPRDAKGDVPWGLDIVDHCAGGVNYWTGETGTRICYLECSWYGRVGNSIDSLDMALRRMRERLGRYPKLANLPISIAEFAVLNDEHGHRLMGGDITEWGASWYAAVAERVYALNVQQVHEWSQATAGILHPRTHVIGMLELMQGGRRLAVSVDGESVARAGAIGCAKNGSFYLLVYNHRPWRSPAIPEQMDLIVQAKSFQDASHWTVSEHGIDREHGVFVHQLYADCEAEGVSPLPDSPHFGGNLGLRFGPAVNKVMAKNRTNYIRLSQPAVVRKNEPMEFVDGTAKISFTMPGHGVRLLVISPAQAAGG